MSEFTTGDLAGVLRESAGDDEATELSLGALDVPFEDLGYDSLALLQTASLIERKYGVEIPESETFVTPRELLDYVNDHLTPAAGPGRMA